MFFLIFGQEHQAGAILTFLRDRNTLQKDELMWYLDHDACTIAILAHLGTPMAHVLKHTQGVVDQLMAFASVDVHDHSHATSVMLILTLI